MNPRNNCLACAVLVSMAASGCAAGREFSGAAIKGSSVTYGIHQLDDGLRSRLLKPSDFTRLRHVEDIPGSVQRAFAASRNASTFAMAEPGAAYQEFDVVWDKSLPDRRLVFVGLSRDQCVIHYEKGGRGHSFHVVLFSLSDAVAELQWRAVSYRRLGSPRGLRDAIGTDALNDDPAYSW